MKQRKNNVKTRKNNVKTHKFQKVNPQMSR
jgi:hypothetical protein